MVADSSDTWATFEAIDYLSSIRLVETSVVSKYLSVLAFPSWRNLPKEGWLGGNSERIFIFSHRCRVSLSQV